GSRSDGVVRLSYEYGLLEVPQPNERQGVELAKSRCAAWGYPGAEAFGGQTQVCTNRTSSGCNSWLVTREYQCLGTSTPPPLVDREPTSLAPAAGCTGATPINCGSFCCPSAFPVCTPQNPPGQRCQVAR